jgi:hypothetical protein
LGVGDGVISSRYPGALSSGQGGAGSLEAIMENWWCRWVGADGGADSQISFSSGAKLLKGMSDRDTTHVGVADALAWDVGTELEGGDGDEALIDGLQVIVVSLAKLMYLAADGVKLVSGGLNNSRVL